MTTDGFLVCPVHGDVFWTQGAAPGDAITAATVEPVHELAPTPADGDDRRCFCGSYLRDELRPTVVRVR